MLLLKIDFKKVDNVEDFCMMMQDELNKILIASLPEDISVPTYSDFKNLDCVWDLLCCFDFNEIPCKMLFSNACCAKYFSESQYSILIKMFDKIVNEYPNTFTYKIYDQDIIDEPKTVTLEFIDLNK